MKILVSLALLIFSALASAQSEITGAFGLSFGDVYNANQATGERRLTDGTPILSFKPDRVFADFTAYFVLITPTSSKIYGIWAMKASPNTSTCKKDQAVIQSLLEKKYGEPDKQELMAALSDAITISQGPRAVMTKCSGLDDVTLEIRYNDRDVASLAERERIDIEASKLDASGL